MQRLIFKPKIGEPARRLKKWAFGKRHLWRKSHTGHNILCGEGCPICQMIVDPCMNMSTPWKSHCFNAFGWKTMQSILWLKETNGCPRKWPLLWAGQWPSMPNYRPKPRLESWKEEQKLETNKQNMQLSTILLVWGLGDKVGEKISKLETLVQDFAKPGGHKLPQINTQTRMTKPS